MLNDNAIRALRPSTKPQKFSDEKGLQLLVTPSGGRLWRFRYRFPPRSPGNKENSISLGSYPEVSLEGSIRACGGPARRSASAILLRPSRANFSASCARRTSAPRVAAELIERALKSPCYRRPRSREPISARTVDTMERRLEMHVFPYIGERDVQLLRAPELLEVLRRIESRGTYDLAHRVRSICSRVFRYARATGRQCEDVAADLIGSLTPVQSEPMAAIVEPAKIGALLRSIEAYRGEPLTCLALKLLPYVFTRPIEFRTMECAHVQLHGAAPEWRVPWRRMKMRKPHIVPLSRQAAEILREVQLLTGKGRWVFPQLRNPDRPMSGCCILAALRAMGYAGTEMSCHGFRSLASTQLHELGWHDRWIETQLSHADRNKVRASYNHAQYLPQRRTMMQAWADYLDSLRARVELDVSHQTGQQAALTAMDAFQSIESERALSFQAQAMEALRTIIALSPKR
jgi:integrase